MKFLSIVTLFLLNFISSLAQDGTVTSTDTTVVPTTSNFTAILHSNLTDYKPSGIVLAFHNLPHWENPRPGIIKQSEDPVFKTGSDPKAHDYYLSLVGFPTLLFCIGILALLFLQLGMLGYMDWAVPKMGPIEENEDAGQSEIALWTHKVEMSRKMWVIYFFIALLIGFFGNNIMFYGDDLFNKGFVVVTDSLNTMATMVNNIGSASDNIKHAFQEVETLAQASATTCPLMSTPEIKLLINNEYAALSDMSFNTEVIREAVVNATKQLNYFNHKKQLILWIFYGLSLGTLLCFVGCFFTKQSFYMNISIIVCQIVMIGLLGLCTFELIFMMGLGDFCMNPTMSVVDGLDGQDILQRTAKFYSQCSGATGDGDNFIHRSLADAYEKRRQLGRALQILYMPTGMLTADIPRIPDVPVCQPHTIDKNVQRAFYALQALAPDFQGIASSVACENLHARWRLTFEVALCSDTLYGVFSLWWAQIITTAGLFLTSIAASIMMLYFDKYWDISTTMAEKVNSILEHANDPYAVESDTTESNPVSVGTRSDGYTPVASTSV